MVRGTGANVSIARIIGVPSGIPDGGLEDPLVLGRRVVLEEYVFDSPEAPSCKGSDFRRDFSWTIKTKRPNQHPRLEVEASKNRPGVDME